jgi:hypothetical protein
MTSPSPSQAAAVPLYRDAAAVFLCKRTGRLGPVVRVLCVSEDCYGQIVVSKNS